MKRSYLILACLLPFLAQAQKEEGRISYEEKLTFNIELNLDGLPPEQAEAIKKRLPKSQTNKKVLLFDATASLYKSLEEEQPEQAIEEGDGNVQMKIMVARPDEQVYRELKTGKAIEKRDLMGKTFIINKEPKKTAWKLTDEQKTILGYNCRKAVFTDSTGTAEAWFTPELPIASGPSVFSQLPGLILEIKESRENKVSRSIVATDIKFQETTDITPPSKGKEVTEEEFRKIAEEKRKEMQESHGGGRMIIRNH